MRFIIRTLFLLILVFAFGQSNLRAADKIAKADSIVFPSLNRAWTAPEFQEVLNSIIANQNDASGNIITLAKNERLFNKLTDIKNYWFLDSGYHLLGDRFNFNLSIQPLVNKIILNYYQKSKNVNGKLSFESEIAAFFDLLFGITKNQTLIAEEFMRGTPNPTQVQLDGIKKMIQGVVSMEGGALITIGKEYGFYSEASVCKMSISFNDFYSFMYSRIDAESKAEFDKRIADLIRTHPYVCVRESLQIRR
jgi:hypothetical protein